MPLPPAVVVLLMIFSGVYTFFFILALRQKYYLKLQHNPGTNLGRGTKMQDIVEVFSAISRIYQLIAFDADITPLRDAASSRIFCSFCLRLNKYLNILFILEVQRKESSDVFNKP
jgi:hypothetical protein